MLYNVTLVRLVSTYLLVAYHARPILQALGFGEAELDSIRAGTDLFIVCSAFLTVHVNTRRPITAWAFLRKRIVRIVPLYWVMTVAVAALAIAIPSLFESTAPNLARLLKSLFFVPYLKGSNLVQPIVFVAWTLNLIVLFSLIYALGIAVAGLKRAWIAAMLAVALLVTLGQASAFESVPLRFYTDPLLAEFVFGLLISRFTGRLLAQDRVLRDPATDIAAALGLGALALAAIVAKPYLWPDLHRAVAYGLPCAVLLMVAIRLEGHGLAARAPLLQRMAAYSYALYLSHFFSTAFFSLLLHKLTPETPAAAAVVALVLLILTLASATLVGMLLHRFVEKPLVAACEAALAWIASKSRPESQPTSLGHRPADPTAPSELRESRSVT